MVTSGASSSKRARPDIGNDSDLEQESGSVPKGKTFGTQSSKKKTGNNTESPMIQKEEVEMDLTIFLVVELILTPLLK